MNLQHVLVNNRTFTELEPVLVTDNLDCATAGDECLGSLLGSGPRTEI
jgi:hypothetical protein